MSCHSLLATAPGSFAVCLASPSPEPSHARARTGPAAACPCFSSTRVLCTHAAHLLHLREHTYMHMLLHMRTAALDCEPVACCVLPRRHARDELKLVLEPISCSCSACTRPSRSCSSIQSRTHAGALLLQKPPPSLAVVAGVLPSVPEAMACYWDQLLDIAPHLRSIPSLGWWSSLHMLI